jgi:hypothetical protein
VNWTDAAIERWGGISKYFDALEIQGWSVLTLVDAQLPLSQNINQVTWDRLKVPTTLSAKSTLSRVCYGSRVAIREDERQWRRACGKLYINHGY